MNDLAAIAFGAGLQDGLNPCMLMTCAVFIVQGSWFKRSSIRISWLRVIFVLTYAVSTLIVNFGPAQIFIFQKNVIFASKILYLLLGVWAFVLGLFFFKDWILLRRGLVIDKEIRSFVGPNYVACLVTVILGVVLSALAAVWPINNYVMILGNEVLLKGQWQMVMPLLGVYVLMSMWPLWFVWAFLSVKNVRPSLLKIVCASIFFTASSVVIVMFK